METGGSLTKAALAFEAAVQQDDQYDLAWESLGHVQAQNEKEGAAIKALEKALSFRCARTQTHLTLAVSYLNDGREYHAYKMLAEWLQDKYPDIDKVKVQTSLFGPPQRSRNKRLYLESHQKQGPVTRWTDRYRSTGRTGRFILWLGQLWRRNFISRTRTELDPINHVIWNRLGATLANSGQPEAAIEAYYQALEISPNFVRAATTLPYPAWILAATMKLLSICLARWICMRCRHFMLVMRSGRRCDGHWIYFSESMFFYI